MDSNAEYIDLLAILPWERTTDWHAAFTKVGYKPGKSKEEAAQAFLSRLEMFLKRDLIVYTDSSQISDGSKFSTGAGWVGFQSGLQVFSRSKCLSSQLEVFNTEAHAAHQGLLEATRFPTARIADNIHICLNNLAVAARLYSQSIGSSQAIFKAFSCVSSSWTQRK